MNDLYQDREQSQVKHKILERYLQAFSPIIGSKFDEIVYVDCMAGPWESRDKGLTDTSFHKALTVLRECLSRGRCKRVRALLIEKNADRYSRLEEYGSAITDIEVTTKPWDFTDHVQEIADFAKESKNSFPFFFIDPTGWSEVCIDRIRPILQLNPGEVLINFMSSWVRRFLDDPTKPFEKLLGSGVERLRTLQGEELDDELVNVYASRVREAGQYAYACAIPILMPDRDEIHYHLVFGTRSFRGLEEFKKTEAVAIPFMHNLRATAQRRRDEESSGQGFLLSPAETYQEKRFRSFNARRSASARADVMSLLVQTGSTTYRAVYQESMQYSTVLEQDLREWLDEWKEKGLIRYPNWSKSQRAPHSDTIIKVVGPLS
jgi:three-Cys-motif partner protein